MLLSCSKGHGAGLPKTNVSPKRYRHHAGIAEAGNPFQVLFLHLFNDRFSNNIKGTLAEWLRRRPAKPTNTSLAVLHPLALIFLIPPTRPTGSSLHSRTPPFSSASFPSFLFPHRPASRPHPSDNRSPIFIASHFHLFSPLCLLSFSWFRGPSCYLNPPCEVSLPPPGSPTQVGFIAPSSSTMFSTPDLARI